MDHNRRFEDLTDDGGSDPRVMLGILIAEMRGAKADIAETKNLAGRIADDVTQIKIDRATESGKRTGILSVATLMQALIVVSAGVISAWVSVKAAATTIIPSIPTPPHP